MKKPKPTKAELLHRIDELHAQLASTYAFINLEMYDQARLMGSGVFVKLYSIGKHISDCEFVIKDGFSVETIKAMQADIMRSYKLATAFTPKGVSNEK